MNLSTHAVAKVLQECGLPVTVFELKKAVTFGHLPKSKLPLNRMASWDQERIQQAYDWACLRLRIRFPAMRKPLPLPGHLLGDRRTK